MSFMITRKFSVSIASRIGKKSLLSKVCKPEDTIKFFEDGQALGWSGFTPVGYPKVVPVTVADYVEKTGKKMKFDLYIGASVGAETEDRWAKLGMINRRWPYQTGKNIANGINTGKIQMGDIHLCNYASNLKFGFFTKERKGKLDLGIIEVTEILPDGGLVLAGSVGAVPEVCDISEKLILELNTSMPSYLGLHDIPPDEVPPNRRPYLISRVDDRIGKLYVPVDTEKIVAIVESTKPDNGRPLSPPDEVSEKIAQNILDFLENEVHAGRAPPDLLPLQSGVGNIANAVVAGLAKGQFRNVKVWTEVLQDTMLDFFDTGKLDFATATALTLSTEGFERLYKNWEEYKQKICLRPQQITNNAEMIRRMGVIGMNTPVEVDIYGHANSTLIGGTRMINGLGGSNDFLRNCYISMMHCPSVRPTKTDPTGITCIVPKAPHIDHTEHDLDVIVTEQGLADLRGLAPRQRAMEIINKCAHPDYKPILTDYFNTAYQHCLKQKAAHEPQILSKVFKMQEYLEKNGTMKVDKW
ncbi:acetyl-coa hydrolase [Anaeramoeba ignava]|uniref:Acetyl-CoA hydrolase n=1 Tax=Anaeramoeba ignava TaxID=1746090 RepID=A0A9Q0RIA1_ANAIG|nr:acetyl-coa hydrolase [Anaeramoeba ignava]